jgi:uncharacterized repeat protein (TIGR01451 family)
MPVRLAAAVCALALLLCLAAAGQAKAAVGDFHVLADSPVDLTSVTVDPTSNLIYAQENQGTGFFSYDPRTNVWTPVAVSPLDSGNNGGAAYLGGKIYTVYTNNNTDMGVYDIASNTWTTVPNPLAQGTGNIVAVGDSLYLANANTFVRYTPATSTTTPLANPPASGFNEWGGLEFSGGKIYGHQGDGSNGFYVYDIASDAWTRLTDVPTTAGTDTDVGAVLGSALDPISRTYFTAGNYSENHLLRYDIGAGTWSAVDLPFVVDDNGMAYVSLPGLQGIYIVQGESGTAFTRYETAPPTADLALTKSVSAATAKVGGSLTYTLTVSNGGPQAADGVVVTDTLPAGTTFVSAAASQGSCTGTTTVTCAIGTLANGASATVTINVKAASAGSKVNSASVTSTIADPTAANNTASATTTVAAKPKPKPSCTVPNLRHKTLPQARKALKRHHCRLGTVKRASTKHTGAYRVRAQSVRAGRKLKNGTRVRVTLARTGPLRQAPTPPPFTG